MMDLFFNVTTVILLVYGIYSLKKSDAINKETIDSNNKMIESNLELVEKLKSVKDQLTNNN
jgi:hypothetical protein